MNYFDQMYNIWDGGEMKEDSVGNCPWGMSHRGDCITLEIKGLNTSNSKYTFRACFSNTTTQAKKHITTVNEMRGKNEEKNE